MGERAGRAGAALGACWAAAVVTAAVPIAHLVLVPALLVAGPVLAYVRFRSLRAVLRIRGRCPRCGVEQDFPVGGAWGELRAVDCPGCRNQLTLSGLDGGDPPDPGRAGAP